MNDLMQYADYVIIVIAAGLLVLFGSYVRKHPDSGGKAVLLFKHLTNLVVYLYNRQVISKKYANAATAIGPHLEDLVNNGFKDDETTRELIGKIAAQAYLVYDDDVGPARAEAIAKAAYVVLLENQDIATNIRYLLDQKYSSLEVQKLTLLLIDAIGQFFNMKDKLEDQFFKDIIYALNQCLMSIKKGGVGKKSVERIGEILFRLHKISRAYGKLKDARKPITKREFYEKVYRIIALLFSQ